MFKVIVAGGREFSDYQLLSSTLDRLLSRKSDVEIVSGAARGADSLAIRYAGERLIPLRKFCLLYTYDAADDLLCVDLGGRRIIKKKTQNTQALRAALA